MKIKYINTLLLISTLFLTACNFNTLNNDDGKSDNTNKNTSTQEQNQNQKNQSQYNQQKLLIIKILIIIKVKNEKTLIK